MKKLVPVLILVLVVAVGAVGAACSSGEEATPTPEVTPTPTSAVKVSIDVHSEVDAGSEVAARVNISHVTGFDSYRFDVTYDPAVIEVIGGTQGVAPGVLDTTRVLVDRWKFITLGQGAIRVFGGVAQIGGVPGSGYLAEIHFRVVGPAGDSSTIQLSNGWLGSFSGDEIGPVEWLGSSVRIVGVVNPTPTQTAESQLPCRFYGKVQMDGADVANGTTVVAVIQGDVFQTVTPSIYGSSTYALEIVPPEGMYYAEGATVTFVVADLIADQSAGWVTGGNIPLDLTVST